MRNGDEGLVGGGAMATRDSVAVVPDLIGRVEGDARRLLERAGFTVGDVMFREDDNPVGTVLQTYPVPGERVTLPATVNLILADRRRVLLPDDSLQSPPDPDSVRRSIASLIARPDSLP
jgi:beta-lactam-binding protein with PASTA domain